MEGDDPFVRYSVPALYHFTDRRNLPLICQSGGLFSMADLIEMEVEVPYPGGNEWSHNADKLNGMDRYVHLCLKTQHPMEYRARKEGRIGESIFLEVHLDVLKVDEVKCTDGVSNKTGVLIRPIDEAKQLIDFEVLFPQKELRDTISLEDYLRFEERHKQRWEKAVKCEILVPDHITIELIRNIRNG